MPRHSEMDYRHTKWHCEDCWDAYVQEKRHGEMIEALHSTVPEDFVKPKIVFRPKPQKDQSPPSKGPIPDEPIRRTPEPESS